MTNIKYESMKDTKGIRLNGNENGFNPFKEYFKDIIKDKFEINLNRYPDNSYEKLRSAYGNYCGISEDNIISGNGSDEMINLLISKYIGKDDRLITLDPDFSMYDFYVSINQGNIYKYKFDIDDFKVDEFIKVANDNNGKVIIFSNPNNPTGNVINRNDIMKLLECCEDKIIIVDEAYYEFYGETVIDLINDYENLVVTRTLSKAWGMASLRVGFLIANGKLIEELNKHKVPYNINNISTEIASNLLKYQGEMFLSLEKIKIERENLYDNLKKLESRIGSINFYKGMGNFIYGKGLNSKKINDYLKQKSIFIRYFNDNSIRITVGTNDENIKLIEALKFI